MLNNIGSVKFLFFTAILMAVALTVDSADLKTANIAIENFESDSVPKGCSATNGAELIVTPERFKSGEKSLRWTWTEPESSITVASPSGPVVMGENDCLAFWVYNEQPAEKILWLELLKDGNVVGRCWYVLNFKGWRPFAAPYKQIYQYPEHFMLNPANTTLNAIRLTAPSFRMKTPSGVKNGRLYLDYVNFNCHDKPYADNQQPWIGNPEILNSATPEAFIYSEHDISKNRTYLPSLVPDDKISEEEKKSMAIIAERVKDGDKIQAGTFSGDLKPRELTALADPKVLDDFRDILRIRRSPEGIITGRPVISATGFGTSKFNDPEDGFALSEPPYFGKVKTPLMARLVGAYLFEKGKGNKEAAAALLNAFFDICDHLLDQGYDEGDNNISSSGFDVTCITTMRDELAKTGRLRDMLLSSAACGLAIRGDVLMIKDWEHAGYFPRNTDFSGEYRRLLALTTLLPDQSERLQRLYAYQRTVSLLCDPALGEPYAWDGTVHHHPMFHIAYACGVFIADAYNLRGSCFRLNPDAIAMLKRSFMAMAFMGGASSTVPPNIPGYTGQPLTINLAGLSLMLSHCDTAESRQGIDPEVAAIFLAVEGEKSKDPHVQEFRSLGIEPYKFSGHKTLNGASIALHRRDNWLVSIAGQYKFRRPYEPNPGYIASAFNHYSRNGSVFVVSAGNPPSPWDSGYRLEGWDHRHQPGTTGYLGETEAELRCRLVEAENTFGGGTDMDDDGIWGLEFIHQSSRFSDNIRFHKSAFCFGNRITMITTDIGRGPGARDKEKSLRFATTLFQNSFGSGGSKGLATTFGQNSTMESVTASPEKEPCWIDGEKITAFPFEKSLLLGAAHWLIDNKNSGYYIHPNPAPLRFERHEQKWNYIWKVWAKPVQEFPKDDPRNFEPTTGNFAIAWFDHGSRPDTTECVYTLIPETTPEAMGSFAKEMANKSNQSSVISKQSEKEAPYRIIQKDAKAHILWDRDSNTTGYIIFDHSWSPSPTGDKRPTTSDFLLKANRPCSVMLREKDGNLRLSAASTDMDSWPGWAESKVFLSGDIVLSIVGKWEIAKLDADAPKDCSTTQANGITTVKIPYRTFMPVRMTLKPEK
ncbi:MAG: chondroitinase family protein [Victivallales bacterium]|jgi:chondroitin-sulfate-ABC endolyase/exolyase